MPYMLYFPVYLHMCLHPFRIFLAKNKEIRGVKASILLLCTTVLDADCTKPGFHGTTFASLLIRFYVCAYTPLCI